MLGIGGSNLGVACCFSCSLGAVVEQLRIIGDPVNSDVSWQRPNSNPACSIPLQQQRPDNLLSRLGSDNTICQDGLNCLHRVIL